MMPVMDGITMTMKLREHYDFPVIMLSAKSEEIDKVTGLNIGADDYVTKPFAPMELMARVNSHLRRYSRYLNLAGRETKQETGTCLHHRRAGAERGCGRGDGGWQSGLPHPAGIQDPGSSDEASGRGYFLRKKSMIGFGMKRQSPRRRSWFTSGISGVR